MLSNAYFLVKFHFDTAENEPAKKIAKLKFLQNLPILGANSAVCRADAAPEPRVEVVEHQLGHVRRVARRPALVLATGWRTRKPIFC